MKTKAICIIGPFPPPVLGLTTINSSVRKLLRDQGNIIHDIDLSTGRIGRGFLARITRARRVAIGIIEFILILLGNRCETAYFSVSGGKGKIYEIPFVLLARLFRYHIILHHHSFAYVNAKSALASMMFQIAGPTALHIVLCDSMGKKITSKYQSVKKIAVISNTAFIESTPANYCKVGPLKRIGFLGSVTREKGIYDFIDVARGIERDGLNIEFYVAGPFENNTARNDVLNEISDLGNIVYLGPIYGQEKENFLEMIDVLLFPTDYVNEAEPLTIAEAMNCGVAVIARERGCIKRMIGDEYGILVNKEESFVEIAKLKIEEWYSLSEKMNRARMDCIGRFRLLKEESERSASEVFDLGI